MTTYTQTYEVLCTNRSQNTVGTRWAAIPRDSNFEAETALVFVSDVVANVGNNRVKRTIVQQGGGGMIPDPQLGDLLRNYYTTKYEQELGTPVSFTLGVT